MNFLVHKMDRPFSEEEMRAIAELMAIKNMNICELVNSYMDYKIFKMNELKEMVVISSKNNSSLEVIMSEISELQAKSEKWFPVPDE